MKKVIIPLLNLTLDINPIAFSLFGVPIYWYAILIVASTVLALYLIKRREQLSKKDSSKKGTTFGIGYEDIIDLSLILIPVSFLCARIYYVLFNLENYESFSQILNIKDGGLAIYGGMIGGVATAYVFCKKKKISFCDLLDYIAPYLALRSSNWKMGKFYKCRGIWNNY